MIERALVLPSPRALLPGLSTHDPVADLREACSVAVGQFLDDGPERVVVLAAPVGEANQQRGVTVPLGFRVARRLLGGVTVEEQPALPYTAAALLEDERPTALVVMADGSASRGEKAPGHLHPSAIEFDEAIDAALRAGDAETLAGLDPELATEVWCQGVPGFRVLGEVARGREVTAGVTYAEAPYGVAWWVVRWDLGPLPTGVTLP